MSKKELGIVAAIAVSLIISFLALSKDEQRISTRGFDLSGPAAGGIASGRPAVRPAPSGNPAATSLNAGLAGSLAAPVGTSPANTASGQLAAAAGQAPAAPAKAPSTPQATPAEAKAAGLPIDATALAGVGAKKGALDSMRDKLLDHPKVLKYLFNNKAFVNAFFSREKSQRLCQNSSALRDYLSAPSAQNGVSREIGMLQAILVKPDAARAVADTEFAQRMLDCPSGKGLVNDRAAVASVIMANPNMLSLLTNQTALEVIGGSPQAAGMLEKVQSAQGLGR